MFSFKASIKFDNSDKKKVMRGDALRPLLFFSSNITRSGLIVLEKDEFIEMGKTYENMLVKIYFYKDLDTEKEFYIGRQFKMGESGTVIDATGIITEIIGEDTP